MNNGLRVLFFQQDFHTLSLWLVSSALGEKTLGLPGRERSFRALSSPSSSRRARKSRRQFTTICLLHPRRFTVSPMLTPSSAHTIIRALSAMRRSIFLFRSNSFSSLRSSGLSLIMCCSFANLRQKHKKDCLLFVALQGKIDQAERPGSRASMAGRGQVTLR